jgi:hypothetical protein
MRLNFGTPLAFQQPMKLLGIAILSLLAVSGALLYARDYELLLDGNYADFTRLDPQTPQNHEFTFVRLIYNGRIPGYLKNWYTDYPKGDRQLIQALQRLTDLDVAPQERALPIHHPDLFNYPMIYSGEAGQMQFDRSDARTLREYLERGGFWMIDDFWGTFEWQSFEQEMKKVLPDYPIVDIPLNSPIFHVVFDVDEVIQVPNVGYAYCQPHCKTWELDGYKAEVRGIFDKTGRLLVLINHNTDLMDASEWADEPLYPQKFSAYAYRIFSNAVIYTMSH